MKSPSPPQPSTPLPPPDSSAWTPLPVEHLPPPTFWPAGLALAITFIFWGLISSWVVFGVGLLLFALSLVGWIADIRHEGRHHP